MKYSLMTTSLLFEMLGKLKSGIPIEDIKTEYQNMLQKTAALGIPAVEITSLELELFGMDFIKAALKENHLEPACLVHLDQYAAVIAEQSAEIVSKAIQRINDAVTLGTKNMMLALMAQPDAEKYSYHEKQQALISCIKPIARSGAEHGIAVSVEDTPNIAVPLCDSKDTAALLNAVEELHLTFDTGNMMLKGEDPLAYYRQFKDRVSHVHLKDMIYAEQGDSASDGRKMSAALHGKGLVHFPEILKELRTDGYDGYLVIEYVGTGEHFTHIQEAKEYLDKCKKRITGAFSAYDGM